MGFGGKQPDNGSKRTGFPRSDGTDSGEKTCR